MSLSESKFLKWLGVILGGGLVALFGWTYAVLGSVDVIENKVDNNTKEIIETREYHKKDIDNIMFYLRESREDSKIIKADVKELLVKTGGL